MKSDKMLNMICEDIAKQDGISLQNEGNSNIEEVKNLEERIKNTIDTKINELNKKLENFIEQAQSPASAGPDIKESQGQADAHTETLNAEKAEVESHE